MKAELELPPLPDGWADGPVEIGYGVPPVGSIALYHDTWQPVISELLVYRLYAVRKWVPQIVTAGVLGPGWVVIDPDGTYYHSDTKPTWDEDAGDWAGTLLRCLCVLESPQITGRNAIWEIK